MVGRSLIEETRTSFWVHLPHCIIHLLEAEKIVSGKEQLIAGIGFVGIDLKRTYVFPGFAKNGLKRITERIYASLDI